MLNATSSRNSGYVRLPQEFALANEAALLLRLSTDWRADHDQLTALGRAKYIKDSDYKREIERGSESKRIIIWLSTGQEIIFTAKRESCNAQWSLDDKFDVRAHGAIIATFELPEHIKAQLKQE